MPTTTHKHQCSNCGHVWQHDLPFADKPDILRAHSCAWCGELATALSHAAVTNEPVPALLRYLDPKKPRPLARARALRALLTLAEKHPAFDLLLGEKPVE